MTKEQESRMLSNQVLIMEALVTLLSPEGGGGRGYMQNQLRTRISDVQQFKELLK